MVEQKTRKMIFCEPCGTRTVVEEEVTLAECKTSPVQIKLPQLDPATNKTVKAEFVKQPKRYKCPKCGRAAKVKPLTKPIAELLAARDVEEEKRRQEEERRKRIEDGRPIERPTDPEFLG